MDGDRHAGAIVESARARPAPPLRPLVDSYAGYRAEGVVPGLHRGLPSPYLTLIFSLDDPLVMAAHPDPQAAPGRYDTLLAGLHLTPALIAHEGRQSGIQLALTPLGARGLLGLPAGEIAGTDLDAADVLPWAAELRERLLGVSSWARRFAVLDAMLLRQARVPSAQQPEVAWAWQRLLASAGTLPVADLAASVGWSSRHLGQRFRSELGLGTKEAARVVRFDRTRRLLASRALSAPRPGGAATGRRVGLADLAAQCGYYDQAHLAREFGMLAGCAPSRWLVEEFGIFQASDAATLPRLSA